MLFIFASVAFITTPPLMEVSCSLEREVCRAEELRRLLERCAVTARRSGGAKKRERRSRSQPAASDSVGAEELKRKLSSLQQSHSVLVREAEQLRRKVIRLEEKGRHESVSHLSSSEVVPRGVPPVTNPDSRVEGGDVTPAGELHSLAEHLNQATNWFLSRGMTKC